MKDRSRFTMMFTTVLLVLALSAMWTAPVLADGGKPPVKPDGGANSSPAKPQHEKTPHATADLLARVPSGTQIVVTDARGQRVSLASQDAINALATGQTVWCPASVATPVSGGSCSPAGSSLAAVLSWLTTNHPGVAGTIWIQNDYVSSVGDSGVTSFTLNGAGLTTANFALTVKGGWDGLGTNTIDDTDPSEFDGASLSIVNWNGDVTLSDILVDGATGNGLVVTTKKNITLNRVQSNNNTGNGASLDNTAGTGKVTVTKSEFDTNSGEGLLVYSHGSITVSDLIAHNNGLHAAYLDNSSASSAQFVTLSNANVFSNYYGLDVESKGAITLSNVTATSNPNGWGAWLKNDYATTPQNVTLTGTNVFSSNWGGLYVLSTGAITVNNVIADSNTHNGAYLDNCNVNSSTNLCTVLTAQPVNLTGINHFNDNAYSGLYVYSIGAITANNLTANGNGANGAILDNCNAYDNGECATPTAQAVTLTGNNTFNNNHYTGLSVDSMGVILTNNLTANSNTHGSGVRLDNSLAMTPQALTLAGTNVFNNNYYNGIDANSWGGIAANNITANGNGTSSLSTDNYKGGVGAYLWDWGSKGVTLTGTNTFIGNYSTETYDDGIPADFWTWTGGGLTIYSSGAIKVNNVTANGDLAGHGVYMDNCFYYDNTTGNAGCRNSAQPVTLTGNLSFNDNYLDGLDVYSYGNILAADLNASGNGTSGTSGAGVQLSNAYNSFWSNVQSKGTVTLTGTSIFTGNYGNGLSVFSFGAIKASNLNSKSNGGDGAYLDNGSASKAQAITLTNSNAFNNNSANGLEVYSKGAITLSSITANSNTGGAGAIVRNDFTGFSSTVTLTGSDVFNNNYDNGLIVISFGVINVNTASLIANKNGYGSGEGSGVTLANSGASTPKAVTVKGSSYFDGNIWNGLDIYSKGAITASNLTAINNGMGDPVAGVAFYNDYSGASGGVTLSGSNFFYGNARWGLYVRSFGAITVNNVVANGNDTLNLSDNYGIHLDNSNAGTAQPVTLSGTNVANNNGFGGIFVLSKGAIKANNLTAIGNKAANGVTLDNSAGLSTSGITLTGSNYFSDNVGTGLNINTKGAVVLSRLTANGNSADGLYVNTPLTMTLACGTFMNNTLYGVDLNTGGAVTITGAVLIGNGSGNTVYQTGAGTVVVLRTCALP